MINLANIDFSQEVELLSASNDETAFAKLGEELVGIADAEEDKWLRARACYLAARSFRNAEWEKKDQNKSYADLIIHCLTKAAELRHLISMDWLKSCYQDGQDIIQPDLDKANELKKEISRFIREVRYFYRHGLGEYFAEKGFILIGSYWILETDPEICASYVTLDPRKHNTSLSLKICIGKVNFEGSLSSAVQQIKAHKSYYYHQAHIPIKDRDDRLVYMRSVKEQQRWFHREQKLTSILHMLDKWVLPVLKSK